MNIEEMKKLKRDAERRVESCISREIESLQRETGLCVDGLSVYLQEFRPMGGRRSSHIEQVRINLLWD